MTIIGVGEDKTYIMRLLVDVPVCLGSNDALSLVIIVTTFWVINASGYHIILGKQFLRAVHALVDTSETNITTTTLLGLIKNINIMPRR